MKPYRSALEDSLRESSDCADANFMMAATMLLSIAAEVWIHHYYTKYLMLSTGNRLFVCLFIPMQVLIYCPPLGYWNRYRHMERKAGKCRETSF